MNEHKDVRDVERVFSNTNIRMAMCPEEAKETLASTNIKIRIRLEYPKET